MCCPAARPPSDIPPTGHGDTRACRARAAEGSEIVVSTFLLPRLAPGTDEARRLLEEELTEPAYLEAQPNIFERLLADVLRSLARLFDGVTGLGAGPGTLVVAVGAVILIAVAVLLIKPRLNARGRQQEAAVFDGEDGRSAEEHRRRAALHAADGEWNTAVAELLRAIIRSAEERLVIDERPGRTATEAGLQLQAAFPGAGPDIIWLADLFNETHYGSGEASGDDHGRAAGLDARLTSERAASGSAPSTTMTAPR